MHLLMLSIAQLLFGFVLVGTCLLLWCLRYSWFAENREMNDAIPRSNVSWNSDHEFFDQITEFQNDFVS